MKHILSALVEKKSGVLSCTTGIISRCGFNIESLFVVPIELADAGSGKREVKSGLSDRSRLLASGSWENVLKNRALLRPCESTSRFPEVCLLVI